MTSGKSPTRKHEPETVHLWGGTLCLDFANSVDWSGDDEPLDDSDVLKDGDDVRRWAQRVGIYGARAPAVDEAELEAIHGLRLAVHRSFAAHARGGKPRPCELERVRIDYAHAVAAGRLAERGDALRIEWPPGDPRRLRFAIATDAVALLGDAELLRRVRRCPGRGCGWLFVDRSGRRRWCSMQTCGSRTKMRRLYERRRGRSPDAAL